MANYSKKEIVCEENFVRLKPSKLYFDGSQNLKGSRIGILIISPKGFLLKLRYRLSTLCSNNEAEYEALIAGLKILIEFKARNVHIRGDSQLMIKQLTKDYKFHSPIL